MFGLDARIALAIFGALSVISGAALYSAIQEARATALLSDMQEIGKAWESYYLDTGTELSHSVNTPSDNNFHLLKTKEFVEKPAGVTNWSGPYLPYNVAATNFLNYPQYGNVRLAIFRDDTTWADWVAGKCISGVSCSIWVYLSGLTTDTLAKSIDAKVDGGDGLIDGNFRWYSFTSGSTYYDYYLKIAPYRNIHD